MTPLLALLGLIALVGHGSLWLGLVNFVHGTMLPRWSMKVFMLGGLVFTLAAPIVVLATVLGANAAARPALLAAHPVWAGYLALVTAIGGFYVPLWIVRRRHRRPPAILRSQSSVLYSIGSSASVVEQHRGQGRFFLGLPGNEAYDLDVADKTLEIQRLPPGLEGLSIVHLTDLHFTGRIGRGYFERVVELANESEPDLTVVTGDVLEHDDCFAWIEHTLARLRSRLGVYFVLGNHDLRIDTARLRRTLIDAGLIDVAGRWIVLESGGETLLLAGNERPFMPSAPDMSNAPATSLRVLLAHTPDQLPFARRHHFDLMLAGHTHGGQIALPFIGPVLSPSLYGVRYCGGTFHVRPTVLHVSRGVSSEQPVRFNCPPELARLTLVAPPTAQMPSADRATLAGA